MATGPLRHFSQKQLQAIKSATTFEELRDIALSSLAGMPPGVSMVCGPITSGGLGSIEKNLDRFARTISVLDERGENIFTQLPFEAPMQVIKGNKEYYKGDHHLLEAFYLPIFSSGYVKRFWFIPGWRSSYGATWEYNHGVRLGIEILFLKEDFESLGPHDRLSQ